MFLRETRLLLLFLSLAISPLFSQNAPISVQLNGTPHREPLNVFQGATAVQVCGLQVGKTYQIIANPAFPDQKSGFSLALADANQENIAQQMSVQDRPQLRRFQALTTCTELLLKTTNPIPNVEVPMYLSIGCVDCEEGAVAKTTLAQNLADAAKLVVSQGNTADDLVTNVLIGGDCFDVSNISSKGPSNSRGVFSSGQSSINISNGIVLCTGPASVLPGPNTLPNTNGGFGTNSADDPNLSTLTGGNQYDVSVIEFDFRPTANTVQFDFVFGSEEYCEYVNSIYNDVFGFFISGPGINGVKNLAVLPDGITPVVINEVNHLKNSNQYRNNNVYGTCAFQPVTNMADIELDGFTKVLTATANLIPCETYHIKLAISDIGDANYTSAVFLRANSFDAGGRVLANTIYPSTEPYTREGCQNGFIRFYRGTGDASLPLPVNYSILPGNTATPGLDFSPLPASVVIPAGQTEILVPINVVKDQITEGTESFTLTIDNSCSCEQQEITFVIEDEVPLALNMFNQTGCAGSATLAPIVLNGGLPPLSYAWSNGLTTTNLTSTNFGSAVFTVTVTDVCGLTATASAIATVDQSPTAILSGSTQFCPGGFGQLALNFTGVGPWLVNYTANGAPQSQSFSNNPGILNVNQTGSYTLTAVTSQAGCPGLAGGTGTAQEETVTLSLMETNPSCFGQTGAVQSTLSGNSPSYSYQWSNGATNPTLSGLTPGVYTLTVTTSLGCTQQASVTLTEPPLLTASINSSSNINCYQPLGSAIVTAQGGTIDYQYNWSNGNQTATASFTNGGVYTVTITDAQFCKTTTQVTIAQNTTPPTVVATASQEITCNNPEVSLGSAGSSSGPNFIYSWSTQDGHIITSMENPSAMVDAPGNYTLLITNTINGCTATAQATVLENMNYPTALELLLTQPGCNNKPGAVQVQAVQGGVGPFVYSLDGGNTFSNQSVFANMTAGQYDIIVQDINGCEYVQSLELLAPFEPELTIQPEVTLAYGESMELTALLNIPLSELDTLIWSPEYGLTPTNKINVVVAKPFKTTPYTVKVVSKDGCTDEAKLVIRVGKPDIYVPNAIRPSSSDGTNHMFQFFAPDRVINEVSQLQIFDRWGNMVFSRDHFLPSDDRTGGWDGRYQGKLLSPGVFSWWADVELASGEHIQLKGDVTIVD